MLTRWIPPLFLKGAVVVFLTLALLIPISQVDDLVSARVASRGEALARVAETWGGPQTTAGVLLAVPVDRTVVLSNGQQDTQRDTVYVLPDTLVVAASTAPDYRPVGLYHAPIYLADIAVSGTFSPRDYTLLNSKEGPNEGQVVRWKDARLVVLNSDSASLRAVEDFTVDDTPAEIGADGYARYAGVSTPVPESALQKAGGFAFRMKLKIAGSSQLMFLPLARRADIDIQSTWLNRKFEGGPAPLSSSADDKGFDARWSVMEINRSFGQTWRGDVVRQGLEAGAAFEQSRVGVTFYEPVDVYQRVYRAVHYAVLFILITFLTFFLWEQVSGLAIHTMQYLMVGLALAMFYLLLLAMSEHMSFDLAYAISASALVALMTVYLAGVLRSLARALGVGAGFATLYTMLYWILRSEDYSLLMGALLLFGILSIIMVTTRNVDWSGLGRPRHGGRPNEAA